MRVEIWSDVVCPWCYIGKERFAKGLADFPHKDEVEVVFLDKDRDRGNTFAIHRLLHFAKTKGLPRC
jgi:predicted DsbA family dithiol-disulfide isomerase